MHDTAVMKNMSLQRAKNIYIYAFILIVFVAIGLVAVLKIGPSKSTAPDLNVITKSALEEQYGLKVYLVALTGAGGFVDVRIKIIDGEKAKLLLAEKANFPVVLSENDVALNAPEDTKSQPMLFDDNADMFVLYPNSGNAVTPSSQVRIMFGDIVLEPIAVVH